MASADGLLNLIRLGVAHHQQGQLTQAETYYQRVLKVDPSNVDANNLLGVIRAVEGKSEEALSYIEIAFNQVPNSPLILMNYGNVLSELGRHLEALSRFDQGLAVDPKSFSLWTNRGNTLNKLKRYDEAVACHARAIAINPNEADPHYNLGLSLYNQGQTDRANASFERAISLRPGFAKATVARCVSELPVLYADEEEITRRRSAYGIRLQALVDAVDQNPREFLKGIEAIPPFFLPYQGRIDRDLQGLYGTMVSRALAAYAPQIDCIAQHAAAGEQVRVGIVSAFFREHSNWKIPIQGWVSRLDRKRFRLFGYHTGITQDGQTETARRMFHRFVQGPLTILAWRDAILSDQPHVLI